ncbi:histone acetyltransferase gcn5 [Quercus suber]|uniref:Histone acetyltransferase gcn5 n=1 Tax=Quercus suber TaxID=58331 RepID=A0AAW0M103_QUESU
MSCTGSSTKGGRGKPKSSKSVSRSQKSGLQFPVEDDEEANIDSNDDLESISARGGGADSDSDEEVPEAANAEDSDEDDYSIRTFTTARLDAANAGGGSGNTKIKTENLSSYAKVKIENSDGTKYGEAQGTGPAGPTAPAGSSVSGVVVKEDATKIFTENIQTSGAYSTREESLKRERGKGSVGGIVLIARLESEARSHGALKAGSTQRGNRVPLALQFGATFRQEHPLPPTPFAAKESLVAAVRGGTQHGSSHKPRAQRRCDRRGCSHVRETQRNIYICANCRWKKNKKTEEDEKGCRRC